MKLYPIHITELQQKLSDAGATCIHPRRFMKRVTFNHPDGVLNKYLRIRDEGDKITLTAKEAGGKMLQELETEVASFEDTKEIIERLGLAVKSYQETYRELWQLDDIYYMIDERPGLEPFVEVESQSEERVRVGVEALGADRDQVIFGAIDEIYHRVYSVPHEVINSHPEYRFDTPVVFI